ncbi:MAG: hypothetical protein IMHGJWDQ_002012 [Candidatus Fervidibacter sp.]|mgnify:CR=1 FL=1
MSEQATAVVLTGEERELLQAELAALLPALSGERRNAYQALANAVNEGSIPKDLTGLLTGLLQLALETGRARRLYRAEGERILTDLFRKTPMGQELSRSLQEVNKALATLEGQTLQSVRVALRTLGHFTITIETNAVVITIALRPHSVTVDSVSVGGDAGLG